MRPAHRHLVTLSATVCAVAASAVPLLRSGATRSSDAATGARGVPSRDACRIQRALPDSHCTPGASTAGVTQDTIERTICVPGYARRVRPPSSYTEPLKRRLIAAYGAYGGRSLRGYELDHLIPLELGGEPRAVANLWPQQRAGPLGSFAKDAEENLLHRRVCSRGEGLARARREIATDWASAYARDRPTRRRVAPP